MQIIHEEPELTTPFEIRTDPRRIRSRLVDAVMDRRNWQRNTEIKIMLVLLPMVVVVVYWMMFG